MTKQVLLEREEVNITGCVLCKFYKKTELFKICKHALSTYSVGNGESQFHTCQHMRGSFGNCGAERRLAQ